MNHGLSLQGRWSLESSVSMIGERREGEGNGGEVERGRRAQAW